ncbi:MAG: antitermination protein NusB [Luteibacter sp.]
MDQFAILTSQPAGFFVGWGTLSLINAGLAQGKNRSGLLWFLLSLILGPIGTLVLVLMPKVRTKLF